MMDIKGIGQEEMDSRTLAYRAGADIARTRMGREAPASAEALEAVEASAGWGSRIRGVEHRVDANDILGCPRELLCRLILPEDGLGILVALALVRFMQPCGPHPQQAHHPAGDVGFDQELLVNWLCA